MKKQKFFMSLFSFILIISMLTIGCSKEADPTNSPEQPVQTENETEPSAGTASQLGSLKSFSATTLDDGTFTQDDLAAKDLTIINFWALMCGPCIKEMPDLAAFSKALPDHVQMITVCLDGTWDKETTKSVLNEAGYEGITLLSGDGDFEDLIQQIQYTPTTILVDSQGNLRGDAIIGTQKNLSETFLAAVNAALKADKKEEIILEH